MAEIDYSKGKKPLTEPAVAGYILATIVEGKKEYVAHVPLRVPLADEVEKGEIVKINAAVVTDVVYKLNSKSKKYELQHPEEVEVP